MKKNKMPAPRRAGTTRASRPQRDRELFEKLEWLAVHNPAAYAECMALLADLVRKSRRRTRGCAK